jgi:hypothetical protein
MLLVGLLAAQQANADVHALLACRQLPPGQGRADCFERESAVIEREQAGTNSATPRVMPAPAVAPTVAGLPAPALIAPAGRGIATVDYVDGRPLFTLVDGERWLAKEERRLTLHPGSDTASLERTPSGTILHFNGSFYGLHVSRLP